jgi:hypothetical protein
MVGAVIAERFRIVSMLARGGGGAVFQVEELSTHNPAALKMVLAVMRTSRLGSNERARHWRW